MDRLKNVAKSTRDRISSRSPNSRPEGSGSLAVPHADLPAEDAASMTAVNEGVMGPFPGTAVHDYAVSDQPREPPTSLQSSIDAEKPLPETPASLNVPVAGAPTPGSRYMTQFSRKSNDWLTNSVAPPKDLHDSQYREKQYRPVAAAQPDPVKTDNHNHKDLEQGHGNLVLA